MNIKQVLKHFNTNYTGLAALLKISQPAVSNWACRKAGVIPELQQHKLHALSGGVLKVSKSQRI